MYHTRSNRYENWYEYIIIDITHILAHNTRSKRYGHWYEYISMDITHILAHSIPDVNDMCIRMNMFNRYHTYLSAYHTRSKRHKHWHENVIIYIKHFLRIIPEVNAIGIAMNML